MKPHALLMMITLVLVSENIPAAAQGPLPKMILEMDSKEGNPADIAGVSNVTAGVLNSRIWGGGARRRNAWEPNSRDRKFDEEAKDFLTGAAAFEVDMSSPLESNHRLFTLTTKESLKNDSGTVVTIIPARLRVENISDQTLPVLQQPEIVFDDDENPLFMRVAPSDKLLLVGVGLPAGPPLTPTREIRIFSYASGTLVQVGVIAFPVYDPMNPNLTSCGHFFTTPQDAQVASILVETSPGSGVWVEQRVALVTATLSAPLPPPPCGLSALTSQTRGLLVLNLQDPANPFWYDTDFSTQAWDPCRDSSEDCDLWFTGGFCHVRTNSPPADLVYITGGPNVGIRRIDLTHVADPATGIPPDEMFELWSTPAEAEGLFAIRPDPQDSNLLYVYGRRNAFVVDRMSLDPLHLVPVLYQKNPSDLNFTNAGDTHLTLVDPGAGPVERESWTLGRSTADHILRITDFTQDGIGGLDVPDTSEGHYSAGPTDGAVASFAASSVYCLTFGGITRWDISGDEPIPIVDSYQPATVGGLTHTTEDLALANLNGPSGPPDMQLIANAADGGFVSWHVNPTTHDPEAAVYHAPLPSYWPPAPGYGNDIDVWDNFGVKWVILDFSSAKTLPSLPHGKLGIGAMRWSNQSWGTQSIQWADPGGGPVGWAIEPNIRDIDVDGNCVVAGANYGFITSRIPLQAVTDYVYTNSVAGPGFAGLGFSRVMGVALYDNRLFVSLGDLGGPGDPDNRFAFAMYGFKKSTGTVVDINGNPTESPIQVLFDGQELTVLPIPPPPTPPTVVVIDDFPGVFIDEGQQIALVQVSANPLKLRLFSGSSNGVTVDIEYNGSTDLMTPKSYWHNGGYFASIAEATPYKVGKPLGGPSGFGPGVGGGPVVDFTVHVLVAKSMETFELVIPPDLQ